jgi:hypothetical protein
MSGHDGQGRAEARRESRLTTFDVGTRPSRRGRAANLAASVYCGGASVEMERAPKGRTRC